MIVYNTEILKCDTDAIVLNNKTSLVGYNLSYMIKKSEKDLDSGAIKCITPILETTGMVEQTVIKFGVDELLDLAEGTYYHALKVVQFDTDGTTVLMAKTLMAGTLKIVEAKIQYPAEV